MAVATITLVSSNGDSAVVSAPNDTFLDEEIILDTDPKGLYATGFKVRTQSGAFEPGGRIVGEQVPIREMVLPFWLTQASRRRFQKMWGTPGNFQKVRYIYDGPSGPRALTLRLAKEIEFTTDGGFDADIDDEYHAVVSAIAVDPNFESPEDVSSWVNPDDRFTLGVVASGGTFPLTFGGKTTTVFTVGIVATGGTFPLTIGGQTATGIPYNASIAAVTSALEALPSVGAGNVTVIGTPGAYFIAFTTVTGTLTSSTASLTGSGKAVNITSGVPWNASPAVLKSALESLSSVGVGKVGVAGTPATASTPGSYSIVFAVGTNGVLTSSAANLIGVGLFSATKSVTISYAPNTGWFDVWNPTDQALWNEWELDPAEQWQFPDFAFGQERKWGRTVGQDAARMIVTPKLTKLLSVMSDPFMDTYVNADLSNAAGLFNGVEPLYMVPPYTGTDEDPVVMPVICRGPAGSKVTLRQRRFWSAESGLEQ